MKSFVLSTIFFILVLGGIVLYQFNLTEKTDSIFTLTENIEKNLLNDEREKVKLQVDELESEFVEMQKWIMAFEDHEQVLEMTRCIKNMKTYCKFFNKEEILTQLYSFRYLVEYSVQSVKPSLENIL